MFKRLDLIFDFWSGSFIWIVIPKQASLSVSGCFVMINLSARCVTGEQRGW